MAEPLDLPTNPFEAPDIDFFKPVVRGTERLAYDFMKSLLSSATIEMVRIQPPTDVLRFRRDMPFLGLASELSGLLIPYAGWAGVAGKIPKLVKTTEKAGKLFGAGESIWRGAAQAEMARWAPFELGRIGVAATVPQGDVSDTIIDAATDLGLFGGLSAGLALVKASGPRASRLLEPLAEGVDPYAPPQIQMRQAANAVAMGKVAPEEMGALSQKLKDYSRAIREEPMEPFDLGQTGPLSKKPPSGSYVNKLEFGADPFDPKKSRDQLNRLFNIGGENIERKALVGAGKDTDRAFRTTSEWKKKLVAAQIDPLNAEAFMQFPRHLRVANDKGRKILAESIDNMEAFANNTFIAKEADSGLYIVAKRGKYGSISPRRPKGLRVAVGDEFIYFKTDTPQRFMAKRFRDGADRFSTRMARLWEPPVEDINAFAYTTMKEHADKVPLPQYIDDAAYGRLGKTAKAFGESLGVAKTKAAQGLEEAARASLYPAQFQFRSNLQAQRAWDIVRSGYDAGLSRAQRFLHGSYVTETEEGKSLYRTIVSGVEKGGVSQEIAKLDKDELRQLSRVFEFEMDRSQVVASGFSDRVRDVSSRIRQYEGVLEGEWKEIQGVVAGKQRPHLFSDFSRTMKGFYRARIYNEDGQVVFVTSGKKPAEAAKAADDIVQTAANSGKRWRADKGHDPFPSDEIHDIQEVMHQLPYGSDDFNLARLIQADLRKDAPWTAKELDSIIRGQFLQAERDIASASSRHLLSRDFVKIAEYDPPTSKNLAKRLDQLEGKQGPISQAINEFTDKALAPIVGRNSATKIVGAINHATFELQLGALNVGFVALNAMQTVQTVLPRIAFELSSSAASRQRYNLIVPALGPDGLPRGTVGVLEPLKLSWRAMKEMGKPSALLRKHFNQAGIDGTVVPRFAEESIGEKAITRENIKDAFKRSPLKGILAISEYGPTMSEKWVRSHAFVVGHILGRDIIKVSDEGLLYQFAKQFTEQTMFNYSVADRAQMMTGPIGSLWGFFKNFLMHQLGWTMVYADEAVMKGNWGPLLWSVGGTWATAGVGGIPLYVAADHFAKWATGEGIFDRTYGMFDPGEASTFEDGMFYGLPGFFGVSLQASGAAPFADPAADASFLWSFPILDRAAAAGKAFGSGFDAWVRTGDHPINNPETRDQFIRAFAPKTFYRAVAAAEDGYIRSLTTGLPNVSGLSAAQRYAYIFGVNPTAVDRYWEAANELWREKDARDAMVETLGRQYDEARRSNSWQDMQDINDKATVYGVLPEVLRRAHNRQAVVDRGEGILERSFEEEDLRRFALPR